MIGKCFSTQGGHVRRILSIEGGKVVYETRGPGRIEGAWPRGATVSAGKFIRDAERPVPCDWTPEGKEQA
jgi:hypothetical protein